MVKTIRVSEKYHEWLSAHKRDDETMEETLRRLTGGPDPETVAGILSEGTVEDVRERLETKRETELDGKADLRGQFE